MRTRTRPEQPRGSAYDAAVRYLAARPRSVSEIERHLRSKRYDAAAIEAAVEHLREQRYVDDEAFARYWLEQRARFRPKGERALRAELLQKGIPRGTIDTAFAAPEHATELQRARDAIRRPLARWAALEPGERKRKAQAYLLQRGFGYETVEEVLLRPEPDEDDAADE